MLQLWITFNYSYLEEVAFEYVFATVNKYYSQACITNVSQSFFAMSRVERTFEKKTHKQKIWYFYLNNYNYCAKNFFFFKAYIKRRRLPKVKKENYEEEETVSRTENAKLMLKTTTMRILNCFLVFFAKQDLQSNPNLNATKNKSCWNNYVNAVTQSWTTGISLSWILLRRIKLWYSHIKKKLSLNKSLQLSFNIHIY